MLVLQESVHKEIRTKIIYLLKIKRSRIIDALGDHYLLAEPRYVT